MRPLIYDGGGGGGGGKEEDDKTPWDECAKIVEKGSECMMVLAVHCAC